VYGWLVKIKNVYVGGAVVTAIKRKNPLYLINPFLFGMAW
jgi:hypothetical protein